MNKLTLSESGQNGSPASWEIFKKHNINHSALLFHNFSSNTASFVELLCPYMLLYEKIDQANDLFTLIEFSQNHHYIVNAALSNTSDMGNQPLHKHEFYEFTYVMSGELHIRIENDIYRLSAGECCLCNCNVRHLEMHDSDCEFVLIMLQKSVIDELMSRDYIGTADYRSTCNHVIIDCLTDFHISKKKYDHILKKYIIMKPTHNIYDINLDLLNHMVNEWTEPGPGSNFIFMGYLCRFLSNIDNDDNYHKTVHSVESNNIEDLFTVASLYIEESNGTISRGELENKLGYSGDYLTKIIHKFTGLNFVEYCQHFSLTEAERLLSDTTLNIETICLKLGYNNRTHFYNIFKKKYGMTPKQYRMFSK